MKYPFIKRSISRYIYLAVLLAGIFGFSFRLVEYPQSLFEQTGLGISWWVFYPFSFGLLAYQIIFNNKIGWFIIAGCIFYAFILAVLDCINIERYEDIFVAILMFSLVYLLFAMLFPRGKGFF